MSLASRVKNAWNVFLNKDPTPKWYGAGESFYYRPDKTTVARRNDRSTIATVLNRFAVDAAACAIKHVRLDDDDRYIETIDSHLNECLTLEANVDQTGRGFVQDAIQSMLDEGYVALVPTDTEDDLLTHESTDIYEMRVCRITQWYPEFIKAEVYNEKTGRKQEITLPKDKVAILENPFYATMNEPNSTMQRLSRKFYLLDAADEKNNSGKLDLIIQLPYVIKSDARRAQAEERRQDIEMQLSGSKYGVAYIDGTEHVIQLNRAVENNLLTQIEYLTNELYSKLGITIGILDGTADEKTMQNYYTRIIEPILSAVIDEMKRKFLTKTARSQKQSIMFFRDPFKLIPVSSVAEIADKFTRNEILTSNEVRQIVGMKPSKDPGADELRNKNLNQSNEEIKPQIKPVETEENQNGK